MAEPTKNPVAQNNEPKAASAPSPWAPFDSLRREIDRLFDDFRSFGRPFTMPRANADLELLAPTATRWSLAPAIDLAEKEKEYEITAELPGLDEKDIEVKVTNHTLTIRGEKKEEREEKQKDYHISERRYGSFQRSFRLPEGVEANKIEADFSKGVLKVKLPKSADAQEPEKKITIKAA